MTEIKNSYTGIACLFDLDGVIVDSESQYSICWAMIDKIYPTGVDNFPTRIKGTTLSNILNTYFPEEIHLDIIDRLNEFERNMHYDIKPGVINFLTTLKNRNIPAVMVTSSNNEKMNRLWEQQPGLKSYFTNIITADMIHRSKPDPEGYLMGASMAGVPADNCFVFEDSVQGVMAGHRANAHVVGVSGTVPAELLEPYADLVISSFENFDINTLLPLTSSL